MKDKFLFAFSTTVLLSLSACSGKIKEDPFLKEIENAPVETDETILEEISVVNAEDGVYGNVYLPEEVNGAKISWWSSDRNIIFPQKYDDFAAGDVDRPSEDTVVNLKAKIEKDGEITKFEQDVLVKGLDYVPEDEDYEAYLFAHFIGEGTGKTEDGVRIATELPLANKSSSLLRMSVKVCILKI